jgi:hypothetical protein
VDSVRSLLCDIWNAVEGLSPLITFLIGVLSALVASRIGEIWRDRRMRRATREAIAVELRMNIQLLDAHEQMLVDVVRGMGNQWPAVEPITVAIGHAADPEVGGLLTDSEQVYLALLATQLRVLWQKLLEGRKQIDSPPPGSQPRSPSEVATEILESGVLEITGRFLVGTFTHVLNEQGDFVLSASTEAAQRLQPLLKENKVIGSPVWRTSDLTRWPAGSQVAVAWKNDTGDAPLPSETIVLSPVPLETFDVIDRENERGRVRSLLMHWRRFRALQRNKSAVRRLEAHRKELAALQGEASTENGE